MQVASLEPTHALLFAACDFKGQETLKRHLCPWCSSFIITRLPEAMGCFSQILLCSCDSVPFHNRGHNSTARRDTAVGIISYRKSGFWTLIATPWYQLTRSLDFRGPRLPLLCNRNYITDPHLPARAVKEENEILEVRWTWSMWSLGMDVQHCYDAIYDIMWDSLHTYHLQLQQRLSLWMDGSPSGWHGPWPKNRESQNHFPGYALRDHFLGVLSIFSLLWQPLQLILLPFPSILLTLPENEC